MTSNLRPAAASACIIASTVAIAFGAMADEPRTLTYKGEPVLHTTYDPASESDLLTSGLGVSGIQSATPPQPADPVAPTAEELRTIAIYNNTRALVDTTTAGGYGRLYGPGVPLEPGHAVDELIFGDEFLVFSDRGTTENVTMMVQVPLAFDPEQPCIVTGPSSGSRGVYGAIGTSGEWGLKRGCAVAYTDKGTGTGAHDLTQDTVNLIRGEREQADAAGDASSFTAPVDPAEQASFNEEAPFRFAFKHAHSRDNPERLWGGHVLESIRFAFFVLNEVIRPERFPDAKIFWRGNTIVIGSSVSNGGGATILAAERDWRGLIDGIAVSEPNVNPVFDERFVIRQGDREPVTRHSQPLYRYTTLLNVFQGCANLANPDAPSFDAFASLYQARCQALEEKGLIAGDTVEEQAAAAQRLVNEAAILQEQNLVQPIQWILNVPQAIAVTYANAYARASVLDGICGYSFGFTVPSADPPPANVFQPAPLPDAAEAIIFGTSSGIPPTGGVDLINDRSVGGPLSNRFSISPSSGLADENLDGALCLRALALGEDPVTHEPLDRREGELARRIQAGIEQILAKGDLHGTPTIIVTGRADGVIPPNHGSRAYFGLNQLVDGDDSRLSYVEVENAQHLDALIPVFPTTYVPLHHYFLQALDLMFAHLSDHAALPASQVVRPQPRQAADQDLLLGNLPPIEQAPDEGDRIEFIDDAVVIPE
ncbi:MAG TPA: 3-hydroxybutyrate oligomer hydrolase family protein [Geminicoccaceae bacterium]|nr:3-hydroxybutyrate oligomer hydrolase family protein [Geminicoccaceae bacterium]